MTKILLVGGGSGGHVYPLIAVAEALQKKIKDSDTEIILLGEGKFFDEAVKDSDFKYKKIIAGKLRRYLSLESFLDLFKMIAGFFQSFWYIFWLMPDVVFAKGGYASFFPALWAKFFLIPIYVHDSDSVPGMTNRLIGKLAKKVFVSFESAKNYFSPGKVELVGNPIRSGLLNGNKEEAFTFFNLSSLLPTVVILGGSQGAKKINEAVLAAIFQLTRDFQVVHQCGDINFKEVSGLVGEINSEQVKNRYRLYPFFKDKELALAYALGDVFVSRASAGGIFEISALGKPAIFVPIKNSAQNHQHLNALEIVKHGGILIEEENLIPSVFINEIKEAYQKREELGVKIKSFARLDAAEKIAEGILLF
ncbi:MAG: UDP-N-acetylglucosamine--N-acetylmuramyl-(pentapeptide) pyrophosphoryl-undecaprenol N-acetylglucosamine transferase [Candidatus Yanofskybacteria bacterium]|nr:UDP-N-acetylglucosamine--N-acetylmuramyl-(pentapeptide) pyrophosphoryl-undecaprenol N-acetylglucosamine transferase [Candidatus Yanofskybacteria bacterium]